MIEQGKTLEQKQRMWTAIGEWMLELDVYPGWKEWRRRKLRNTLYFDEPFAVSADPAGSDFKFSDMIELQHAVIMQYLGLLQSAEAIAQCEFYFRRFPFRGLPISRHDHITNVCEMYFGRFYEFKERLKKYFEAIKKVAPNKRFEIGKFIRLFEKTFDNELRARHAVHHHSRFEDITIDRVFLTDAVRKNDAGWQSSHTAAYRKATLEWVETVRKAHKQIDEFVGAIAEFTIKAAPFLRSEINKTERVVSDTKA